MSGRVYNRISNGALLLGIASAFLYDSGRIPNSVAVAVGVIAATIAIILYFWNQHESKKVAVAAPANVDPANIKQEMTASHVIADADEITAALEKITAQAVITREYQRMFEDIWRARTARVILAHGSSSNRWMADYRAHHLAGRHLRYAFPREARLMTPEVELSPKEAAACAIEIILSLAIQDKLNEWEYVFDAKGLRVSMKGPYGTRAVSSQDEFRFDAMEAFAE